MIPLFHIPLSLAIGFGLDCLLGDPAGCPHLVRLMGRAIRWAEPGLRRLFPATPRGELVAGGVLATGLPLCAWGATLGLVLLWGWLSPWLALAVESLLCWQCLALHDLKKEARNVWRTLTTGTLPQARQAVARIVGRDTQELSARGVTKAAMETVAENASDGVLAPMLFLALGGAPLGTLYKAVNTLDSMVGYKNQRYLYFGRAAARLDDLCNYLPARLSALLMAAAALPLAGLDGKEALRIWRRDRRNHQSPNSAQTEAACAGALGVELAGDATYGGVVCPKPTIGDSRVPICPDHILGACRLVTAASWLCLGLCLAVWALLLW